MIASADDTSDGVVSFDDWVKTVNVLREIAYESIDEDTIPYEDLTEVQKKQRDEDNIPFEKLTEPQKKQRKIKEIEKKKKEMNRKAKKQTIMIDVNM